MRFALPRSWSPTVLDASAARAWMLAARLICSMAAAISCDEAFSSSAFVESSSAVAASSSADPRALVAVLTYSAPSARERAEPPISA
jgi:hypothetical protein